MTFTHSVKKIKKTADNNADFDVKVWTDLLFRNFWPVSLALMVQVQFTFSGYSHGLNGLDRLPFIPPSTVISLPHASKKRQFTLLFMTGDVALNSWIWLQSSSFACPKCAHRLQLKLNLGMITSSGLYVNSSYLMNYVFGDLFKSILIGQFHINQDILLVNSVTFCFHLILAKHYQSSAFLINDVLTLQFCHQWANNWCSDN